MHNCRKKKRKNKGGRRKGRERKLKKRAFGTVACRRWPLAMDWGFLGSQEHHLV